MAQLQSTTITGTLSMPGHAAGYMKINAEGTVVMDTSTLATQSYVSTQITNLINGAPGALDTLNELAAALGNDASFATSVTNSLATKLALAGGTMTGALNIDYANAYLYIKSANSGSGIQWHDQIWLGRYDRVQTASQYPNYLPGAAYGLHITQSSDAVFFGLISRGANSNDYNAVIAWGDDAGDILQFRFNNGVVASLTDAGTFNATNITLNSAQVATQSWVTSQGYITGSYLPLSGGSMTGDIILPNDTAVALRNASGSAGFRPDDQWGNTYTWNTSGGYYVDATSYFFRNSVGNTNWLTISSGNGTFTGTIAASNISTGVNASHIVQRDGNGYIYANHINFNTSETENSTINSFITSNGDGWSRKASLQHAKNSIRDVADGTWGINVTGSSGSITGGIPSGTDHYINLRVIRNANASPLDGMYIGYGNGGSGNTRLYGGGSTGNHAYVDVNGDIWRSSGGHQYVYNTGTWGINITGNSATTSQTNFGSLTVNSNTVLHAGNWNSYAAPRAYVTDSFVEFTIFGDQNTYYPVTIHNWNGGFGFQRYSIHRSYYDTAPWNPIGTGTHQGGLTFTVEWSGDIAWGGNDKSIRVIQFDETYTNMVAGLALAHCEGMIVWLRGGGSGGAYYRLHGPGGRSQGYNINMSSWTSCAGVTYSPRSHSGSTVDSEIRSRFPIRGSGGGDMFVSNSVVLHAGNYNSYAPTLTGGNASGTWGISITGSAGSASSASSVPWSGVSAGTRNNYTLGFSAPSSGYAGFEFFGTNGSGAGYFLIRGTSDSDVYTAEGITLVADQGWLTLAQRTRSDRGVRIMTGSTSTTRLQIDSSGNTDVGLGAGTVTLYHGGSARFWTGSDGTRTQGWAYFQNTTQGLHWPGNNWHLHPASASDFIIRSGSNTDSALRFDTNGTTRGYVYAENDNTIGFLNNGRGWALRVYSDNNIVTYGHYLTVGQGRAWSSILMHDSDEGTREIHCNSNRIGFLTQSGNWGAYLDDSTNWYAEGSIFAKAAAAIIQAGSTSSDGMLYDTSRAALVARGNYPHVELWSDVSNGNHGGTLRFGGYDNGSSGAYKSWNIGAPGSDLYFLDIGYGGYNSNPHAGIAGLGAAYGYPGAFTIMRFHNNGNIGIGNFGTYGSEGNTPNHKLDVRGNISSNGTIYSAAYRGNANVGGTGEATWHPAGMYSGSTQWLYGTMYRNGSDTYHSNGSLYQVNQLQLNNGFTISQGGSNYGVFNSWVRIDGSYGLYSGTNNAHIYPNNASYGSWRISGSRNGWGGIEFDNGGNGAISLMIGASSNESGFHNNSYGWQILWSAGTLYCGKGGYGGSTATVLDSSNYSSWAQPISSAINTGNIGSQSVSYASSAGSANYLKTPYQEWDFTLGSHSTVPMSISLYDNYTQPGAPTSYGTLIDIYGLSGHQHDQLYFAQGSIRHRYGWYGNNNWNGWYDVLTSNTHGYAANMNQYVRTSDNPTFGNIYSNGWFRNNNNNQGLYSENTTQHWSSKDNGYWDASSTTTVSSIRLWTGGHISALRGYLYANTSNEIGFLDNAGDWTMRTDSSSNCFCHGTLYSYNDVIAYYSDERLKTKTGKIENALEKVCSLEAFTYTHNELAVSLGYDKNKESQIGLSAQEVQKIAPELVALAGFDVATDEEGNKYSKSGENYLTIKYDRLVPLLIEAIKEQQIQIEDLKKQINNK